MDKSYPSHEEINDILNNLTHARIENWLYQSLFSWQWFLLVFLFFASWLVFFKLVDRRRLGELLLYGLMIIVITITFDEIGIEFVLWTYPIKLVPIFPRLITIDLAVIPVTYMLVYQYFQSWKGFIGVMVGISAIYCFIAEPVLELLGLYVVFAWKHCYGFPIYVLMAVICKLAMIKVYEIEKTAR